MNVTMTLNKKELTEIITLQLGLMGYKVQGDVTFLISKGFPGSNDPREQREPELTGFAVEVKANGRTP